MRNYSRPNQYQNKNAGFTLVEMVAVMVLLSFGLIGGSKLLTMTAQSYRDTSARMKQTQDGRFVIERLSRELREALPGSLRTSTVGTTQCIEWLPIAAASRYLSLPTAPSSSFPVMEIDPDLPAGTTYYAVIFPTDATVVYTTAQTNQLVTANPITDINSSTDQINLVSTPSFTTASPADRIFFVTSPVALCVDTSGKMLRYSKYGFVAPTTSTTGVLMAENLLLTDTGTVNVFTVSGATLTRNSMVQLDLRIRDPNTKEVLRLQHTVFVRNVP